MNDETRHTQDVSWFKGDWRIWLGGSLTALWILGGGVYIAVNGGVMAFFALEADQIGSFLEGFFAPLAFLWLVLGLFMQQRELAHNTKVLEQTNANSEYQTQILETTELRARQAAFFQIAENVKRQTGNLAGMFVRTVTFDNGEPLISDEDWQQTWMEHQSGSFENFTTLLVSLHQEYGDQQNFKPQNLYFGTAERTNLAEEYVRSFQSLILLGEECDSDGTIVRTITQTTHGVVYREMLRAIRPPTCWVLMGNQNPLRAQQSKDIDISGKFQISARVMGHDEVWTTELWREGDRFVGRQSSEDGGIDLDDIEVHGNRVFMKFTLGDSPYILTANIDAGAWTGRIDSDMGTFATFSTKIANLA